ncbi:MAG: hypothetical protein HOO06_10215 [Bdellovibrionaceae bacterium]|jgi:hypothetical protein|nr:hypothetical protein [Pseudobdellovibrionaceae bacterium]
MKKIGILVIFSLLTSVVWANEIQPLSISNTEHPGVHQRLFSVLKEVYKQQLNHSPCDNAENKCIIQVENGNCLRNASCQLNFVKINSEVESVELSKSNGLNLTLYLVLRKASAIGLGDIERFGPRYRPHFLIKSILTCEAEGSNLPQCY